MPISFFNNFMVLPGQYLATVAAKTNDHYITGSVLVVTPGTDNDELTGCVPDLPPDSALPTDGALLYVINTGPNTLVIPHNDSGSTAGYRFILTPHTTCTMEANTTQQFFYVPDGPNPGWYPNLPPIFS